MGVRDKRKMEIKPIGLGKDGTSFIFDIVIEGVGRLKGWVVRKGYIYPPSFRRGVKYYSNVVDVPKEFCDSLYDNLVYEKLQAKPNEVWAGMPDLQPKEMATRPLLLAI